ncbi:hypothetical protein [Thermococcus sp.]|nr:hypothetical protein [Thermococcus sp.]
MRMEPKSEKGRDTLKSRLNKGAADPNRKESTANSTGAAFVG